MLKTTFTNKDKVTRRRHRASPIPRSSRYALRRNCCRLGVPSSCGNAAGWTYCGVGALSLLGQLPSPRNSNISSGTEKAGISPSFVEDVVRCLVYRQTSMLEESKAPAPLFRVQGACLDPFEPLSPISSSHLEELQYAGFNGRCNKVADTCYSFWVGGTLAVSCPLPYRFLSTSSILLPSSLALTPSKRFSTKSTSSTSTSTGASCSRSPNMSSVASGNSPETLPVRSYHLPFFSLYFFTLNSLPPPPGVLSFTCSTSPFPQQLRKSHHS